MKVKIILVYVLIFVIHYTKAQTEWAPIGAKWYNKFTNGEVQGLVEYFTYESVKDTVVDDKNCRKLEIYYFTFDNDSVYWGMELIHQDGEKVYTYHSGDFHILYDFTLTVGDTLESFILNSLYSSSFNPDNLPRRAFYKIIAIGDTLINGIALNYQNLEGLYIPEITDFYQFWIGGKVIEKIGSLVMLLGEISPRVEMPPWWGPLRCYVDNEISFSTNPDIACDAIYNYNTTQGNNGGNEVRLFPNPATTFLEIESSSFHRIERVSILNYCGMVVRTFDFSGQTAVQIPMNGLVPGVYIVEVRTSTNKCFYSKVVKD